MNPQEMLHVLSINDETAPALSTNLIHFVKVANCEGEGGETDHISHWMQHVHLLGLEEPIAFDLLFIDIRFHEDRFAPKYGDERVNPLGLLHALTFAARQDPFGPPFIWGYHSGDPGSVQKDPIAIIAFSLLSALEQRGDGDDVKVGGRTWKWNDVGLHNTEADELKERAEKHFSRALASLPKGGAEVIWRSMVIRYRNKFLNFVDEERMFVDQDQMGLLLHAVEKKDDRSRKVLAEAVLEITGPPARRWTRKILLQSLFADELVRDCKVWPADKLKEVTTFLTAFKKMGASGGTDFWFGRVKELMRKVHKEPADDAKELDKNRSVKPPALKDIKGITSVKNRRCLGALGVVCWWLEHKASGTLQTATVTSLLKAFGYYSEHPKVLLGCLKALSHTSIADFLVYLNTTNERLPSPYASVGLKWWIDECKKDGAKAPKCISMGLQTPAKDA
jgi:hypothetical protein